MSPHERALLLQHGVTLPIIEALERVGQDTLAILAGLSRQQLADIADVGAGGARAVRHAVGKLMDIELADRT